MSLIRFHRFLIATAVVFCLGYGVWEIRASVSSGAGGFGLLLGSVFILLGLALAVYLKNLARFLGYDPRGTPTS